MNNKKFDILKIVLPEYDNVFIFDLVDNTDVSTACYLLSQKGDEVSIGKIVDLMDLLGNYPINFEAVTDDELNEFMIILKKWMHSNNNHSKLGIEGVDDTGFIENVKVQDYELINSFIEKDSSIKTIKKH